MSRDANDSGTIGFVGPPFRMIPDPMLFNLDLLHIDVRLYGLLLWHGRSGNGTYPGRKKLAQELGVKSVRTVDSALQRLQEQGYLTITPHFDEDGRQDRNRYTVYSAALSPEQRQIRRKANANADKPPRDEEPEGGRNELHPDKTGGEQLIAPWEEGATDCTVGGATDCAPPAQPVAHHKRDKLKREEEQEPLPAVGDYSTVGSSALAAVPAGKPRPLAAVPDPEPATAAEPPPVQASASTIGDVYRAFTAVMPPDLMPRISKRSGDIASIIRVELAHRSPAELVERIGRRWETWRYRVEDIRDPVAVAQTLLRQHLPGRTCPDLRCEDGHQLDLDQPCTACAQVADEVAAQRAKAARPATSAPEPTPADAPPALLAPSVPFPPPARERAIEARPDTPPGFTREDAAPAYARGLAEVRATLASQKAQRGHRSSQPDPKTIMEEDSHA